MEQDNSGRVVRIDDIETIEAEQFDRGQALASGLVQDERDVDFVRLFANSGGLDWLTNMDMQVAAQDVEAVIRNLNDTEAISVANVVAEGVLPPHPLYRVLATLVPAMRGTFAEEPRRASQARRILQLVGTCRTGN